MLLLTAAAGLLLASVASAQTELFHGRGQIIVLNGSSFVGVVPSRDRIGCLDDQGILTLDNCAEFSLAETSPRTFSTVSGNCTFQNKNMPANSDSAYGKDTHAWSCLAENQLVAPYENYYTVSGFKFPFICNGNLNCYYDIKGAPSLNNTRVPVWQFYWGDAQGGITPGHLQTLWLWVPVNSTKTGKS
ncbi:hypothetical protein B0T19DRAFT_479606 [Cercophora scortea]|uniref:Uncharacterized protein n=1 Tax=Cercophora scortea TaxID=314031 RepID=A0AAE0I2S7_9PEZI|nr:hypothetical protein B0T19DRAFT_479606 [Cercophora scortea]